ncbi:MAG TPA: RagB/SusD family nutrient uptake outer membrane protein [Chitinophagaceae bacterium]|nr:RagB/SusD family nutrient uptake outer membrane protein [Chitinophagaceae bacterium]
MKRSIIKGLLLVALGGGILSSCKKSLEVDPRQSVDAATALTSRDGINAAINGAYARFKGVRLYGRDLIALPEALSDNGYATNKSGRLLPEANNAFNAHFTGALWQTSYIAINDINLVFDAIPKLDINPAPTPTEIASWEGQLHFLRGLYHFNLALAFAYIPGATVPAQDRGGVPIMLTGTTNINDAPNVLPGRAPIADVYTQVVSDLTAAQDRLPFTTGAGFMNTANKVAAQALLSRVNLYRKNYTEAKRWADSCITRVGSRLTPASAYVTNWRIATHQETLFQVLYATNSENTGVNESLQTSFTTLVTPGVQTVTGGFGDLVPSISMLNDLGITLQGGNTDANFRSANAVVASRTADVRNLLYEPGTAGRGKIYVEATKYIGKNGFINLDNVPVVRVAEVYLNRAEAMATPGSPVLNETAALADLNLILTNRGLPAVALTGTALYEEILRQRRIELAFEGHRFWDIKRLGRDIIKAPHYTNVAFTDARILAPIPQREVDGNPNLKQNFGY